MSLADESTYSNALQSVAKIVSVYLEQSAELKPDQLVSLVENVLNVLHQKGPATSMGEAADADTASSGTVSAPAVEAPKPLTPAVAVDQSVTPDYLVCLEDGNKVKLLKRYLRSKYDLTPRQYREKWGLPKDYPMVAPAYSAKRTAIARASGLGARKPETTSTAAAAAPVEAAPPVEAPAAKAKSTPKAPSTKAPKATAAAPKTVAPATTAPKKAAAAKKAPAPSATAAAPKAARGKKK